MARRNKVQKVKYRYRADLSPSERQLLKETTNLINETNRRLASLEKGIDTNKAIYNPRTKRYERPNKQVIYSDGAKRIIKPKSILKPEQGTWASKKLVNNLSKYYNPKTNRLEVPSNTNIFEIRSINKNAKNFINSITSTLEGIKDVQSNTKKTLENIVGDIEGIESEDINTLYDFFNNDDFRDVTQFVDPSELFIIMSEAKSKGNDADAFLSSIKNYNESVYADEDLKESLSRLYNKFSG